MVYFLNVSYDEKSDEFFAFVDDGTKSGKTVYQIDSTEEMCDYIKTSKMNHIDDVKGLEIFLKAQELISYQDIIILNEELLW